MRAFLVCALLSAQTLAAQGTLKVRVADSTDAPLAGAQVSVVDGVSRAVSSAVTNARGEALLIAPPGHEYQVVARMLGYSRGSRFFTSAPEALSITLTLSRIAAALPGVSVTAEADLKRKSYHLDADDIAASTRPLMDGFDVIAKLRPYIVDARPATLDYPCYMQDVYVNGERQLFTPVNDRMAIDRYQKRETFTATRPLASPDATRRSLPEWCW